MGGRNGSSHRLAGLNCDDVGMAGVPTAVAAMVESMLGLCSAVLTSDEEEEEEDDTAPLFQSTPRGRRKKSAQQHDINTHYIYI